MQITTKILIDLETFVKTGKFDLLKMGMTKHEVLAVFSEPEDWSNAKNYLASNIWRYGNFELHFEGDTLLMLFNDYIATMNGGKSLKLNRWIFEPQNDRTLIGIMRRFNQELMDFTTTSDTTGYVMLRVKESDVCMTFCPEYSIGEEATEKADINNFELATLYKIDPKREEK